MTVSLGKALTADLYKAWLGITVVCGFLAPPFEQISVSLSSAPNVSLHTAIGNSGLAIHSMVAVSDHGPLFPQEFAFYSTGEETHTIN